MKDIEKQRRVHEYFKSIEKWSVSTFSIFQIDCNNH